MKGGKDMDLELKKELENLGLKAEMTTVDTMLDEMGASIGKNSCSTVIVTST
jgi:hypothetical protein